MCHVRDLRLLVPKPFLDLVEFVLFGREPLFQSPRLLDEPRPSLLVTLPADAPGHLVLALLELVRLLYEIRAPVGQLYNQAHVGLDPTVPRILLDGFRVLADVFPRTAGASLCAVGMRFQQRAVRRRYIILPVLLTPGSLF